MKRRTFLSLFATTAMTLALTQRRANAVTSPDLPLPRSSHRPPTLSAPLLPTKVHGVFITNWYLARLLKEKGKAGVKNLSAQLREADVNTAAFSVYAEGMPVWDSEVYREAAGSPSALIIPEFPDVVETLRGDGLSVLALHEGGLALAGAEHPISVRHPDWHTLDFRGSEITGEDGRRFLSPAHPEVRKYYVGMLEEITTRFGTPILLDRLRLPYAANRPEHRGPYTGYDQAMLKAFQKGHGERPPGRQYRSDRAPAELDETWRRFRAAQITSLAREARDAIQHIAPGIPVLSTPVAEYGEDQHLQWWWDWDIDGYFVQAYEPAKGYATDVDAAVQNAHSRDLRLDTHLGLCLYASGKTAGEIAAEIETAREHGIDSMLLWVIHPGHSTLGMLPELSRLIRQDQSTM
jgi:uncharacterized lipoprotein YddW (UPF0748 family)